MNRPQRATVIGLMLGAVGVNFAFPVGTSVDSIWSVDTMGRIVLGIILVCVGGGLAFQPDEIRRGTEPAPVWLLLLIGVTMLLFVARLLITGLL